MQLVIQRRRPDDPTFPTATPPNPSVPGAIDPESTFVFTRDTGDAIGIALDASQFSERRIVDLRRTVNTQNKLFAQGTPNLDYQLFNPTLGLAAAEYFSEYRASVQHLTALHQSVAVIGAAGIGIVSSKSVVEEIHPTIVSALSIRAIPRDLYVDFPGQVYASIPIEARIPTTPSQGHLHGNLGKITDAFSLVGLNSSAIESAIV
jgi:hypothetical protein